MTGRICIVGEAWGAEEARQRMPFVGASGQLLTYMLEEAGINRAECLLTNCFNFQPQPKNDIANICVPKKDPRALLDLPPLSKGKYLDLAYAGELVRLFTEIDEFAPDIIVAAGGTAAWALLGDSRITKLRGTAVMSKTLTTPRKVLPIFHPAAILRDYSNRHVTVLDLMKAKRESTFPELRRPFREVWIEPNLDHMDLFFEKHLKLAERITFDIETDYEQITCIGFAPTPRVAIVVPFVDNRKPGGNYWSTIAEERAAWRWVGKVLSLPCPKVAQNALYDIHWLWRKAGIETKSFVYDTMLIHHALQPEAPKGLEFMGSVYTDEASWKLMRPKRKYSKREG